MDASQALDDGLPRIPQRAYVLRGVPFVPHFHRRGFYVSPGASRIPDDRMLTEAWLVTHGAEQITLNLWPRNPAS